MFASVDQALFLRLCRKEMDFLFVIKSGSDFLRDVIVIYSAVIMLKSGEEEHL